MFSRYTMTSAYLSVIPEFVEKLEMLNLEELFEVTKTEIINKETGSRIVFRGLKTGSKLQTANLKSITGLNIWVLDEAEELHNEELFDDIARSIRKIGVENKIILIFNPPTNKHWLYKRFYLDNDFIPGENGTKGNVTYIHTSYLDNLDNLDSDFVYEAEEMRIKDNKKWKHVYMGAFRKSAEGLIFDYNLGKFPDVEDYEFGLDFGYSNSPNALIKCYINRDINTVYLQQKLYKKELRPTELGEIISKITKKKLVVADSSSPDVISELKHKGVNIKPVKKPKVVDRIQLMKNYSIVVDPTSKDLITEFNNYCWDKNYDLGERPIKEFDHCFVGDTLIKTIKGEVPIKNIKEGNKVLTTKGYKKVLTKFNNGIRKVNKYILHLDNGDIIKITSTPNHKIKTNKGWIKIEELQKNQIIFTSKNLNVGLNGEEIQELTTNKENVSFVNQCLQQINIEKRKVVDVNVVQSYEEEVFDFMVEDEHEYFANNILVHNCMDAWGYYITMKIRKPKRKKYSIH